MVATKATDAQYRGYLIGISNTRKSMACDGDQLKRYLAIPGEERPRAAKDRLGAMTEGVHLRLTRSRFLLLAQCRAAFARALEHAVSWRYERGVGRRPGAGVLMAPLHTETVGNACYAWVYPVIAARRPVPYLSRPRASGRDPRKRCGSAVSGTSATSATFSPTSLRAPIPPTTRRPLVVRDLNLLTSLISRGSRGSRGSHCVAGGFQSPTSLGQVADVAATPARLALSSSGYSALAARRIRHLVPRPRISNKQTRAGPYLAT